MKKYLLSAGLLIVLFIAAYAVANADPPTPHGDPPHGKPTEVPGLNPELDAGKGLKRHGVFGTISALGTNAFTVSTKQGDVVQVTTTSSTKFHIPTKRNATFADLSVGDRVAVNGTPTADGLTAKQVAVAPGKPTIQHRVGIVESYTANLSITIRDVKGGKEVFTLTSATVIRGPNGNNVVNEGDRVTVVSKRDPSTNTFTASAIVVHPKEP